MKKKRRPDKSDLEAIRDQILDFACTKHDFKLEKDDFLPEGDWNGVFIVKFRDSSEEDRLYCEAPLGENFSGSGSIWYLMKRSGKGNMKIYPERWQDMMLPFT